MPFRVELHPSVPGSVVSVPLANRLLRPRVARQLAGVYMQTAGAAPRVRQLLGLMGADAVIGPRLGALGMKKLPEVRAV